MFESARSKNCPGLFVFKDVASPYRVRKDTVSALSAVQIPLNVNYVSNKILPTM
jgi:hypothetical protein